MRWRFNAAVTADGSQPSSAATRRAVHPRRRYSSVSRSAVSPGRPTGAGRRRGSRRGMPAARNAAATVPREHPTRAAIRSMLNDCPRYQSRSAAGSNTGRGARHGGTGRPAVRSTRRNTPAERPSSAAIPGSVSPAANRRATSPASTGGRRRTGRPAATAGARAVPSARGAVPDGPVVRVPVVHRPRDRHHRRPPGGAASVPVLHADRRSLATATSTRARPRTDHPTTHRCTPPARQASSAAAGPDRPATRPSPHAVGAPLSRPGEPIPACRKGRRGRGPSTDEIEIPGIGAYHVPLSTTGNQSGIPSRPGRSPGAVKGPAVSTRRSTLFSTRVRLVGGRPRDVMRLNVSNKHAPHATLTLDLTYRDDAATLTVTDTPATAPPTGRIPARRPGRPASWPKPAAGPG